MNKIIRQLRTTQRAMERSVLGIKREDKIRADNIRQRTKFNDIVDHVATMKWRWAGHLARYQDDRWTIRCTEWIPRYAKRSAGRQQTRWKDDIARTAGKNWTTNAQDRSKWKSHLEGYLQTRRAVP